MISFILPDKLEKEPEETEKEIQIKYFQILTLVLQTFVNWNNMLRKIST